MALRCQIDNSVGGVVPHQEKSSGPKAWNFGAEIDTQRALGALMQAVELLSGFLRTDVPQQREVV